MNFWTAIGSLLGVVILGLLLTNHNLKNLSASRAERVAARRAEKRIKNEKLRKLYGLDSK